MILIREAHKRDVKWVYSLNKKLFQEDVWSRESYEYALTSRHYFFLIAEEEKKLCGFVVGRMVGIEGEVLKLGIAPEFQRRGIGGMLLKRLLEKFEDSGVKEVFLEVRLSNIPAIKLYQKLGFEEVGIRPFYYGKEDALVMKKGLSLFSQ